MVALLIAINEKISTGCEIDPGNKCAMANRGPTEPLKMSSFETIHINNMRDILNKFNTP